MPTPRPPKTSSTTSKGSSARSRLSLGWSTAAGVVVASLAVGAYLVLRSGGGSENHRRQWINRVAKAFNRQRRLDANSTGMTSAAAEPDIGGPVEWLQWGPCQRGSSCRDDLSRAGGDQDRTWPELSAEERANRWWTETQRVELNRNQPANVPTFTEVGYEKVRLPEPLYKMIHDWWTYNSHLENMERWPPDNTYVNHWASPTYMVFFPHHRQMEIRSGLKDIMEGWSNTRLDMTSCYGIRHYKNGSVLAVHVDRVETHVISGIINVDQDVDEDWALYVRGHDHVEREVYMKPGDLLLYESASVIHGRPKPFKGRLFANMFVHYKPLEGWDYRRQQHMLNK